MSQSGRTSRPGLWAVEPQALDSLIHWLRMTFPAAVPLWGGSQTPACVAGTGPSWDVPGLASGVLILEVCMGLSALQAWFAHSASST